MATFTLAEGDHYRLIDGEVPELTFAGVAATHMQTSLGNIVQIVTEELVIFRALPPTVSGTFQPG